jgi:hypothetical protein
MGDLMHTPDTGTGETGGNVGHIVRYTKNRQALEDFLDKGETPEKGELGEALRQLSRALLKGQVWAVRMVLEYALGRPDQVQRDRIAAEDGDDADFDYQRTHRRIREVHETTHRAKVPQVRRR